MRMRGISLTIVALFVLPLQSCCSLARLFCGPDKSEWVSVRFDTPELTVRTFLEALRRDDPGVVYKCLSNKLRKDAGIDQDTVKLVWPLLREQVPGLHLAGYADVPYANRQNANLATIDLNIEGRELQVVLVRQCHWEVRFRREGKTGAKAIASVGGQVANAVDVLTVTPFTEDPPISTVDLSGQRVQHWSIDTLPVDSIESIELAHTWRIENLPGIDLRAAANR